MRNVKLGRCDTNFKVIGLTRLEIKPDSTATEADALITRPSELFKNNKVKKYLAFFSFKGMSAGKILLN